MDILNEIFTHKRVEVDARRDACPLGELQRQAQAASQPADMIEALREARTSPGLIAEVKFHSPSKGELVNEPDPVKLAGLYARHGAAGISVLTDEKYFHGRLEYLQMIHSTLPQMPLLQKDFFYDPYQVYEARANGASSILLIAAYLDAALLIEMHGLALSLNLTPLVEVHDQAEMESALRIPGLRLVGVNNRNLRTFEVNLRTCLDLRPVVPQEITFVAESGIHTHEDVRILKDAKVDVLLIGEALVTAGNAGTKIQELFGFNEANPRSV